MSQKRCRSINWTEEEKQLLIGVLRDFSKTIENKCLKTSSNKAKSTAWEEVHKRFNELNARPRELNQLQIQWKGMKINARKNVSTNKKQVKGTGGGPRPKSPNPGDIDIVELLNPGELVRDLNIYDSDGPLHAPVFMEHLVIVFIYFQDSQPDIIFVENIENDSQETIAGQSEDILVANVDPVPSTSAIKPSPYNTPNLDMAKSLSRKILKTPSRKGRNPMLANTQRVTKLFKDREYITEIINHSKSLKDAEHKKRMEMAEVEHEITLKIMKQNLQNAQNEGEILKLKKDLLEMEKMAKTS